MLHYDHVYWGQGRTTESWRQLCQSLGVETAGLGQLQAFQVLLENLPPLLSQMGDTAEFITLANKMNPSSMSSMNETGGVIGHWLLHD